jgi:DNA polymerase III epsilon subunit-like protein
MKRIKTIAIVDTETTGLGPFAKPPRPQDSVIEIGVVLWSVEHASILSTWSDLIVEPTNDAESINHISPGLLARGTTREDVMQTLTGYAQRADVAVAHRSEFDSTFLGPIDRGDLFDPRILPWVCSKSEIEWPLSKPGDGLAYVALAHKVPVTDTHRALSDCLLLARTFERCAELGHDVSLMLERAMRPRAEYRSMQAFGDNQKAKDAGFGWVHDAAKGKKGWYKTMAIEDAPAFIAKLSFKVERART